MPPELHKKLVVILILDYDLWDLPEMQGFFDLLLS
jgi:hypothetical protein